MRPQDVRFFREILDNHFRLMAVCHRCEKWRRVDVALEVALGRGDHEFERHRPKCRRCGRRGCWAVWEPAGRDPLGAGPTLLPFPTLTIKL